MKKLVCFTLVCLLLLSLSGCAGLMDDGEIRALGTEMLDALLADDFEGSYAIVDQACSKEEYTEVYWKFRSILYGIDTYELEMLQLNKNTTNGRTVTQAVYRLKSEAEPLLLSIATDSEIPGLVSFYLTQDNGTVVSYNGDLSNMRDASVVQWAVLVMAGLVFAFTVWVLVDCCRHKMKRKILWILLIVLGSLVVSCSLSRTSFRIQYNLGAILSYSALLKYTDGSVVCRLQIPVGAIIYLVQRKKLLASAAAVSEEAAVPEISEVPVEEPAAPALETQEPAAQDREE